MSEAGSNAINIDYFKLDFNRYAWTGIFKPGLNFGPILFIMERDALWIHHPDRESSGRWHCLGGVNDFQNFNLGSERTDFVSVTFDGRMATGARGGFSLDNLSVNESTAVPEPASMLLIGSGLHGLVGLRKKFKK